MSYQNNIFVTSEEPTFTHHDHPKLIVYIRVTLGVVQSMGLDKLIMKYMQD